MAERGIQLAWSSAEKCVKLRNRTDGQATGREWHCSLTLPLLHPGPEWLIFFVMVSGVVTDTLSSPHLHPPFPSRPPLPSSRFPANCNFHHHATIQNAAVGPLCARRCFAHREAEEIHKAATQGRGADDSDDDDVTGFPTAPSHRGSWSLSLRHPEVERPPKLRKLVPEGGESNWSRSYHLWMSPLWHRRK
uniref:Uncharacterized protein n=1 Tax=Physcomitrium patens TaxID=3218 RepID=A9SU80_PHYPA|nr:hypothetical protein PHYPA_003186 [Physcomitrium patens]